MNIQVTKMDIADLDTIAPILATDFDDFWNVNTLKDELNYKNSKYIVAKIDNKIVGFAGIRITFDQADIMNIVVNKNYRNKKIGTLLLENLLQICTDLSLKDITLEVSKLNIHAIAMYEKSGFKKISERKNYYKNETALILRKNCH